MRHRWVTVMIWTALLGACEAEEAGVPAAGGSASPQAPARLDIVCRKDGSTELLNTEVRTSADGVHVRVDNRAGESVSINGLGLDFIEGITEEVARSAPGELKVACWPYSMHTDPEPDRHAIRILDPESHWVPGELMCPRDKFIASSTLDYATDSFGTEGDPEQIVRDQVKGIEPSDEISTIGYPEAEYRDVAVAREGETVAVLSYMTAQKGGWLLADYSACDSAGIDVHP